MPLDISSAESSYSLGRIRWEKFMRQFMADWLKPQTETTLAMFFAGITPEERQSVPEVEIFEQAFGQAFGRNGGNNATRINTGLG